MDLIYLIYLKQTRYWTKLVFDEDPTVTRCKGNVFYLVCIYILASCPLLPPDVNDNVPFFTSSIYEASVTEGAESGTLVFQVSAHDLDLGLNGKVRSNACYVNKVLLRHGQWRGMFTTLLFSV